MINYIFSSLQQIENAIQKLGNVAAKQTKFNRSVAVFALIMVSYAIAVEINISEQNKKIKKLGDEIKELKSTKGE